MTSMPSGRRKVPDEFDEQLYLEANPDVREMLELGAIPNGLAHWQAIGADEHAIGHRRSGFFEYDKIYDEETYLRDNDDVAAQVRAGILRHGYEHWIRFGRRECEQGRRYGCFGRHDLKPFRIDVGALGVLLVAPTAEPLPEVEELTFRRDNETGVTLHPASVTCTQEIHVVSDAGAPASQRLLVFWVPSGLGARHASAPRSLSFRLKSTTGQVCVIGFEDRPNPRPFLTSLDDVIELVLAVKRLVEHEAARDALIRAAGDAACAWLIPRPPRAP